MPSFEVNTPVSSAACDRLALGVGPARPGVAGIGGTLNPAYDGPACGGGRDPACFMCFEGNEE